MRKLSTPVLAIVILAAVSVGLVQAGAWPGVDETVVEKYATAAGRPSQSPLFDPGEGDLRVFVFLIAGIVGGFVAGYYFRELFPRKSNPREKSR